MADYHVKLPTGEEYDITGAAEDADPMQLLTESLGKSSSGDIPESAPSATPEAPAARSLGDNVYERTIGEATRQADELAAKLRDPEVSPLEKAYHLGKSGLQGVITGAFPGWTALSKAAGVGTEAATGSKDAGDVAEVAAPLAVGGAELAGAGIRGARSLLKGGGTLAEEVGRDVGAGTTAQAAGRMLQAPQQGARAAIGSVADEASAKYAQAQAAAGDAAHPAADQTLIKAASQLRKDTKAAGGELPGGARRVVGNLLRAGRGKASSLVDASGSAIPAEAKDIPVSDLIEHHSNLSRETAKLPFNHPARAPLLDFKGTLEGAIDNATQDTPGAGQAWQDAKAYYRDVAAPVKKTAGAALKASTPEQAARGVMSKSAPSRFERIAGAAPSAAEPLRSSAWTDAMDKATVDGKLDLTRLSSQLPKDPAALAQWADTPARQLAVKAIQRASRTEKAGATAGSVAMAGGALEFGLPGFLGGYAARKVMEKALTSEPVARAMYRLYTTTEGGPGYKLAAKTLAKYMGPAAAASGARANALLDQEQE